jgi:hypothetical protein
VWNNGHQVRTKSNKTEHRFAEWIENRPTDDHTIDEIYQSFSDIITKTQEEMVPLIEIKKRKLQKPCWWNSEVNAVKKHPNHCQKQYKMRSTTQNKQRLCIVEDNFERAKHEAQETWSDRLVSEFNITNNAKDFWNTFKIKR